MTEISENNNYDKKLMTLYNECKQEYPNIPDIALLMECQRYLKNPNQRTNKHQKHMINQMKKRHQERLDAEKSKWVDENTFLGVSVLDEYGNPVESTSKVEIE